MMYRIKRGEPYGTKKLEPVREWPDMVEGYVLIAGRRSVSTRLYNRSQLKEVSDESR